MTVLLDAETIVLRGACGVEEADTLLALIQQHEGFPVDLSKAAQVHTALWQVIIALQPPVTGEPADDFTRSWLMPALKLAATP